MQSELGGVEELIKLVSRGLALGIIPYNNPMHAYTVKSLWDYHARRYDILGELNDLGKAIEYGTLAITSATIDNSDLPRLLINLGKSHCKRYLRLFEVRDIEKAIGCFTRAVTLKPGDYPELSEWLSLLGLSHTYRFERLGELNDIEQAIKYESRVLLLTPTDHPDLSTKLATLGVSYTHRFHRLGELDDLEKAIDCESRALALTPEDHPELSTQLANLGVSYTDRFQRLGDLHDLEKSIKYKSRAVDLTPDDHPESSNRLANLGVSYSDRYQYLGELEDLEKSINYESKALALTPSDHQDFSMRLANLGVSYIYRYQRLGEVNDLKQAIVCESTAVDLTPDGHPELTNRLCSLGGFYRYLFELLSDLDDLGMAIEYQSRAVTLTPDSHPGLSTTLHSLGASYSSRFKCSGELSDLQKAVEYASRALDLTPESHSNLPVMLSNLGTYHRHRFQRLGDTDDLNKAMEYESRALALTSSTHPNSSLFHHNMALLFVSSYEHTNDLSCLQSSLEYFRNAAQTSAGAPRHKFDRAFRWAWHATKHKQLNCIEAYQTTIDLLPQFVWLGATTSQRYRDLSISKSLAVKAAYVAIRASKCGLALEWLEHARCVAWNQSLMLRSPVDQLKSAHPDLASRLQVVSEQLQHASTLSRESQALASSSLTPEQVAQRHHRLAKEYDDLLSRVRQLPGFEEFLRPMKAESLTRASRHGPVIVVTCHEEHCDALVILPEKDNITHIPLPDFTEERAQRICSEITTSLRNKGLRERGVKKRQKKGKRDSFEGALALLWKEVVKPILDFLGYTDTVSKDDLPHITWCPTGVMSFLPLHAAGDYDQPRSTIFHYVVSSYTPTLTALLSSAPSSLSRDSRVLAIGLEFTPGHNPLPGTSRELRCMKRHVHHIAEYSQLMNHQATTSAVLDAMECHDWVHLACHAHQNVEDPTESGFFLHEGTLDLASINQRSFKNKGLAFLSACQTATGDERLPDESIHLASGMLMAGYTSVIATMWSVADNDAPLVADRVYEQLMKDGRIGNGEAGKALHNATAILRAKVGEKAFERWVPYVHIGS